MSYLPLALISVVLLGVYYFLVKLISPHLASPVIAFVSSIVVFPVVLTYLYLTKTPIIPERKIYTMYTLLISVPLAIALLTIYIAIAIGPVSVVMPIYGLNAIVTALLGILVLREKVSVERVLGLALAASAIILLSR